MILLLPLLLSCTFAAAATARQTTVVIHEQAKCEEYASHPVPKYRIARLDRADKGPMLTLYISISPADFDRDKLLSLSCRLGRDYSNEEILGVWIFNSYEAAKWYTPIGDVRGKPKKTGPVLAECGFSRDKRSPFHSLDWWPTPLDRNHSIHIDLGDPPARQIEQKTGGPGR